MAHFARVDKDNIVQRVAVVDNKNLLNESGVEEEAFGIAFLNNVHGVGFTWVQTSYNHTFRKQYAVVGGTYDKVNNVLISPKPYPSWTLDDSFNWQPPTAYPDDDDSHDWNEDTKAWE